MDGFYENPDNNTCEKCPTSNCSICDSNGTCTQCLTDDLILPDCTKKL